MTRRYNRIPRNVRTYNQNPPCPADTEAARREQEAHEERIAAGQRMMQEQWDSMSDEEAQDFWSSWCA